MPDESLAILDCAHHSGRSPADIKRAEAAILWYFRNTAPHTTSLYADMPDGMAERLHHAAIQADSLEDMLSRCKTKKYTNARLRRSLLYAFFRVSVVSLSTFPAFTCVLAANIRGTAVLNKIKKRAALPLLTKPAHYKSCLIRCGAPLNCPFPRIFSGICFCLSRCRPALSFVILPIFIKKKEMRCPLHPLYRLVFEPVNAAKQHNMHSMFDYAITI